MQCFVEGVLFFRRIEMKDGFFFYIYLALSGSFCEIFLLIYRED